MELAIIDRILKRASGHDVPSSEFDILVESAEKEELEGSNKDVVVQSRPPKRVNFKRLDRPLHKKPRSITPRIPEPEWTMKNESSDLESSDEDGDIGRFGSEYTMTEQRIMAKYISTYSVRGWDFHLSHKERWRPVQGKVCI